MKMIITIFRKELVDSLRDRRTLVTMVVVPLLVFPMFLTISSKFMVSQVKKAQEKILKVGLFDRGNGVEFRTILENRDDIQIIENLTLDEAQILIRLDSLDAYLVFDEQFDEQVRDLGAGVITFIYKATEEESIEKDRISSTLCEFEELLRFRRFQTLNLDQSIMETIRVQERNLATHKEMFAEIMGGFLPYMFIIFCFMGSMYPAIDLAAGEKERGTLETLLTSPVARMQILLGKFGVVVLTGLASAAVSLVGMYLGITQVDEIPTEFLQAIITILEVDSIILLITLLFPLTVFFSAILLSISFFAKTFKEAQSMISPLMILVILPAFIGLMPGMKLSTGTALVPILNVTLATKEIMAGTIEPSMLMLVYGSLIALAALSIVTCSTVFNRESIIFRS